MSVLLFTAILSLQGNVSMSPTWSGISDATVHNESMPIVAPGKRERRRRVSCESCERKERFMAIVSHELRNMLAPVVMTLDVYSRSAAEERDAELLQIATDRSHQLSRLIDDLFDACRLATGKVRLSREVVDFGDVVKRSVQAVSPAIKDRCQDLLVERCDESLMVYADPLRLDQVCLNLLNNATKYTQDGGCIWLRLRRENKSAILEVRDSGCGIKREQIPHLFDFFSRDGDGDGRASSGLGIGLALTKSLVELHGGTIEAQSDGPGCGADFTVTFPCAL
jgi:signal transduction histidine kinase